MRLADFILANIGPILAEWDVFAHSLASGKTITRLALRNDAEAILRAAASDMQTEQSLAQRVSKSKGNGGAAGAPSDRLDQASSLHGVQRVGLGFDIMEVVSEYRALRASVLHLWCQSLPQSDLDDLADLDGITRFNESMDQSLAKAVDSHTRRVDQSRRMFLAILSHDLRNPLSCIRMAAHLVASATDANAKAAYALSQIDTNAEVIRRLIDDLTDFASTGLGNTMPLTCEPVDLEELCRDVINAVGTSHPGRTLRFHSDGDLTGEWDAARLRQVISNLMGNALQHGSEDGPIELSALSQPSTVVLHVRNEGVPIPSEALATIFDPLVRHALAESAASRAPGSIGLGLYIVREIVVAHGGTVEVASTAQEGTTFTVCLPRSYPADAGAQRGEPGDIIAAEADAALCQSHSNPDDCRAKASPPAV